MVSSKKVHCAYCQKKCSGNVLRYQDQYYHKQCFELEQSDSLASSQQQLDRQPHSAASTNAASQQQELQPGHAEPTNASKPTPRHKLSPSQATTRTFTSHSQASLSNQSRGQHPLETGSLGQRSSSSSRQNLAAGSSAYQLAGQRVSPAEARLKSQTMEPRSGQQQRAGGTSKQNGNRAATLPHSTSSPSNGFHEPASRTTTCAGCRERIDDGQALIGLDLHWHVWCFKCAQCKAPLHGEYVAKDNKAYCERDYQKLFGITCVYCKRYITGKVLQAGEAHHFHPSCARCSKCGDPFVPGEEMYLQGEVTWHPRCGPGPNGAESSLGLEPVDDRAQLRSSRAHSPSLSSRSRSRSASPFSYMSRQYGRASPAYADSEAVGDLSRVYTISYLNADPNQGYLRRPVEPNPAKSPQFSRPTSLSRLGGPASERSRCSSRSQYAQSGRDRSVPRGMYSVLSSMRSGSSSRARSPSMLNEEAIQLAAYPGAQKPSPDSVPKIERDDFPAPPFPYPDRHQQHQQHHAQQQQQSSKRPETTDDSHSQEPELPVDAQHSKRLAGQAQERASRPRSREIAVELEDSSSAELDPQSRKEEEELSKIANGIGKIFLQTLKEREKLRAWKRANLDPRNASRTPSATRELPNRMRYDNPTNASPSRDLDRPRPWEEEEAYQTGGEHSPTRTRSSLGRPAGGASSALSSSYGYKVVQSNRSTPRPGYGLTGGPYASNGLANSAASTTATQNAGLSFAEQQRVAQARATDLLGRGAPAPAGATSGPGQLQSDLGAIAKGQQNYHTSGGSTRSLASAAHFRRSMPNVANLHHLHQEGPPKLYPYHLLATSNYRLPPDVDRCHLERHLSSEEFQYIFHCDRLDFYRLPEWKRNELKRRARLF